MRKLDSSVPHRLGRRSNFIPPLQGRPAPWADVVDAAADDARRASLAGSLIATTLTADADGHPIVGTADKAALKRLAPDQLFGVRRPVSHKGMKNYVSRAAVPSVRKSPVEWWGLGGRCGALV